MIGCGSAHLQESSLDVCVFLSTGGGGRGSPDGQFCWVLASRPLSSSSAGGRHTGQQVPFNLTGRWHLTGGQDSTKQVTWVFWRRVGRQRHRCQVSVIFVVYQWSQNFTCSAPCGRSTRSKLFHIYIHAVSHRCPLT